MGHKKRQRGKKHKAEWLAPSSGAPPAGYERIAATGAWLQPVAQGYFNYHAVPGNFAALRTFRREVARAWLAARRHRSQRHRLPWKRFRSILDLYVPLPRVLHPEPGVRFDARYPR